MNNRIAPIPNILMFIIRIPLSFTYFLEHPTPIADPSTLDAANELCGLC